MIIKFQHCRNEFGNFNRTWISENLRSEKIIDDVVTTIKNHFPNAIGLEDDYCYIRVTFYSKEDNDFFKVLVCNGGLEI